MFEQQTSNSKESSPVASGFFTVLIALAPFGDLIRIPWLFQAVWRRATGARPLTDREREAGIKVLGEQGLRYDDVRIAEGGRLESIFKRNGRRAFTTYHIINMPSETPLKIVVHELVHIFQYERAGGRIMWQALYAQATLDDAYDYGGPDGLVEAHANGKPYCDFTREQQAHIIEGYYHYVIENARELTPAQRDAYEFYLGELLAGRV